MPEEIDPNVNLPTPFGAYVSRKRESSEMLLGLPNKKLLDYWAWAYSDILENVQRAVFAEYMVACALGLDSGVRNGWQSYDLLYGKITIEVKASAYLQSWRRDGPSTIKFDVQRKLFYDEATSTYGETRERNAKIWVFALFEPKLHAGADVIDANQWLFYVVPVALLNSKVNDAREASLATINSIALPVRYENLKQTIDSICD